jgi:DNA-binding MarR family transcriptional regulator
MMAATSIVRAQQIIIARVEGCLREFDMTFAAYEALVLLSFTRTGALPLGKMGGRLMIHPASVTNIVDRLTGQGRVERLPHPSDRRTILAQITDEGRRVVKEATDAVVDISLGMEGLSQREIESLSKNLVKFRREAGDFVAD